MWSWSGPFYNKKDYLSSAAKAPYLAPSKDVPSDEVLKAAESSILPSDNISKIYKKLEFAGEG